MSARRHAVVVDARVTHEAEDKCDAMPPLPSWIRWYSLRVAQFPSPNAAVEEAIVSARASVSPKAMVLTKI